MRLVLPLALLVAGCAPPDAPDHAPSPAASGPALARAKSASSCTMPTVGPGEVVFDVLLGDGFSSPPAVDGNMAYFGSINGYTDFFAVQDDGTVTAQVDIKYGVEQASMLSDDGGTLYVTTMQMHGKETTGGYLSDGVTAWVLGRGMQMLETSGLVLTGAQDIGLGGADSSPGLNPRGNRVYYGSVDRGDERPVSFYSLRADDLSEAWEYTTPGWTYSSPAFDARGNIYFGSEVSDGVESYAGLRQGRITSLTQRGTVRWTRDTTCEASGGPVYYTRGIRSYLAIRDRCGTVMKLNPDTGAEYWSDFDPTASLGAVTLGPGNATIYSPAADNIPAAVADRENGLNAYNERTGALEWFYPFDNQDGPALVGDAALYVIGTDGVVAALDYDGNELWTYATGHPMHRNFMSMNECGVLLIASDDGYFTGVATESTGLEPTSACPKYRCDYHQTGRDFEGG